MLQALLLPSGEVLALRATLSQAQFSPIFAACPTLAVALAAPQPDFTCWAQEVSAAISEVRSNTNYPEDWDDLSAAASTAIAARKQYEGVLEPHNTPPASPLVGYALTYERLGTNDSPTFGKKFHLDFEGACAELREWAAADFVDDGDGTRLVEYPGHKSFGINCESSSGCISSRYSLTALSL